MTYIWTDKNQMHITGDTELLLFSHGSDNTHPL